ncbi:hypothetical protein PG994_013011 [Apiospora phragmitis]|uniref:FAD-binding PCMH-type domain-containing protein n=1 Tax=Apiospora phragmitis TaxID=2905665 RepID=A0ABR1T9Y7_9PEZI
MDHNRINTYDDKGDGSPGSRRRLRHNNKRHAIARRFPQTLILLSLCAALLAARLLLPLLGSRHVPRPSYSPEAVEACRDIHTALLPSQRTYFPGDAAYWAELNHYWSKSLADLRPACVVHPVTAAQVAAVVRVLNGNGNKNHTSVRFAVKSGGHDPNPGHASVDGGVLVALRHLEGVRYDAEKGVAYVKPGGEWNDVIGALEPHGVTVVGGRLGIVGVGGYLLQGGLSFLSAQHGLAADSIVAWETVMANGTIVNITQETHPDLAVAMRGGGNQFGIITQFTMKTRPMGRTWGGVRIYRRSRWDQLQTALHNFTIAGAEDPKAAIIFADFFMFKNLGVYTVFFFYDGEDPPSTGPFAEMLKIPATVDVTSTKKYSSILWANGFLAKWIRGRVLFRLTINNPHPDLHASRDPQPPPPLRRDRDAVAPHHAGRLPRPAVALPQPVLGRVPAAAGGRGAAQRAGGGNAMGLSAADPDRVVLNLQCMWHRARDDAAVRALAAEMTQWLEGRLPAWNALAGLGLEEDQDQKAAGTAAYMPLFMNDAMSDQDVLRSYCGYETFRALQRSVDPEGMFRSRVGGYRY